MTEEESIIGYYGKIPSKGDFITKSLPRSFTNPWDAWLREVLAHSKSELGEEWMEYYLTAPVYQYVLASGICGNQAWLGVMMPSVDSVGRYFPMTISKACPSNSNPLHLIEINREWFSKAEDLLLFCLDEDFSIDQLDLKLSELQSRDNDDSTITLKKSTMNRYEDSAWNFPVHENESLSVIYPELVNSLLGTFYPNYSVWRSRGSEKVPANYTITEGLPPHKSVVTFMDGEWGKRGWRDEHIIR